MLSLKKVKNLKNVENKKYQYKYLHILLHIKNIDF